MSDNEEFKYEYPEEKISSGPGPRPPYGPSESMYRALAREHWKEFLPWKYAKLVETGKLEEAIREADATMRRLVAKYVLQGYNFIEARELAAPQAYLFAPEARRD